MRKNKVLPLIMALVLAIPLFGLSQSAYAAEGIVFEYDSIEYDISEMSYGSVWIESNEGAQSWESSDPSIIEITGSGDYYAYFDINKPGVADITATGYDGSVATCTITVVAPDIVIPEKEITCSIADSYSGFDITSGYKLSFSSSDTSVVKIDTDSYDYRCYFVPVSLGTAVITVTDCAGKTEDVSVTVTEAQWWLEKTSIQAYLSDDDEELCIYGEDENNEFTAVSSNPKVVAVEAHSDYCELDFLNVGTATITVKDKYGKTEACKVTVIADPLTLNMDSFAFDKYEGYEENTLYYVGQGNNTVNSVTSSNTNVVSVKRVKDEDYDYYEDGIIYYVAQVTPKGVGTATITVSDQYGQKAYVPVTVTQRYIDESKYLYDLEDSYIDTPEYGDTTLTVYTAISPKVYTTIKDKKYTGSVDEEGNYIIRHIPKLPAGSKITVYLTKGEAKYKMTVKVAKKDGRQLAAKVKTQVYTGKTLKPTVTIKHGKYSLKKGTDFIVKYSNNKKIGRAKATIKFKGNYKGQKAAYFTIGPKGTSISKLTPMRNSFKIKWKKRTANVDGYQIQYSPDKSFPYYDVRTVNNNKTVTVKIVNAWDYKYYVRIRTFKKVGSKKYYSKWSKIKSVKPKV